MSQESDTIFQRGEAQEPDPAVDPSVPSISIKPGWQTSQGQMTGLFLFVIVVVAGLFGYKLTTAQAADLSQTVVQVVGLLGALLAGWRQLQAYTNSRGKIQSNAVWANAEVLSQARGFGGLGKLGKVLGDSRVRAGLDIAAGMGVPGASVAGGILERVDNRAPVTGEEIAFLLRYCDNLTLALCRVARGEKLPRPTGTMKLPDAAAYLAREN